MLNIYKKPQFLTLYVNRMCWEVNVYLIFSLIFGIFQKNVQNSTLLQTLIISLQAAAVQKTRVMTSYLTCLLYNCGMLLLQSDWQNINFSTFSVVTMLMRQIIYVYVSCDSLPAPALDLLDKMLELDPVRRISARAALDCPWLRNMSPSAVFSQESVLQPSL